MSQSSSPEYRPQRAAYSGWYHHTKRSLAHEEIALTIASAGRCTIGELVDKTGYSHASLVRSMRTLKEAKIIRASGRKAVNQPGNPAIYRELTPEGSKLLLDHLLSKGKRIARVLDKLDISTEENDLEFFRAGDSRLHKTGLIRTVIQEETYLELVGGESYGAIQIGIIGVNTGFAARDVGRSLREFQNAGILRSNNLTDHDKELTVEHFVPKAIRFAESIQELRRVA